MSSMSATGCAISTTQAVYETARSVGTPAPAKTLPTYDQYEKERATLAPPKSD
jgi:hypothetical protein